MWITNAGKYAEGELACEPLKLPAATEELQSVLKRIGVDGVRYEEVFISHAQSDISGLCACLTEYENIDALNHLACLLSELDEGERETYKAVLEGGHAENVNDLINLTYNLDCWAFYPDIGDEESLGRLYLQEFGAVQVPEELIDYIDYEAYGRDCQINENGRFVPGGYVKGGLGVYAEFYHGPQDIPAEHRIFAYPKLNIREQLAAYTEVSAKADQRSKPAPEPGREDR